eukprot:scaffold204839_cov33-Cyclotella_meneghiniana.AAC.1
MCCSGDRIGYHFDFAMDELITEQQTERRRDCSRDRQELIRCRITGYMMSLSSVPPRYSIIGIQ